MTDLPLLDVFCDWYRGLLGAHTMAVYLQENKYGMSWYEGELLSMAVDIGYRLLPAFNTSTGIPYPRVSP